jgi:flavin reductase (DIM6/NTAB) family NADH-FMN oxidoreductase RutF
MEFDFTTLPRMARGKLLNATVVPRPIAWVVTRQPGGGTNAAPFSFANVVATEPSLLCIGMAARDGADKDSLANIRRSGQFVVNLVSESMAEAMNHTSIDFPAEVDELAHFGIAKCETYQLVELPGSGAVVIGRVLAMHIQDEMMLDAERHYVDTPKLRLIARMHGRGWYARTSDLFDLPRPPEAR